MRISDWSSDVCSSDLSSKADYALLAAKANRNGVDGPFGAFVGQDDKDPGTYILSFYQSGLGMPDRDYYLDQSDRMKQTRAAYVAHLEKMFTLAGEPNGSARARALLDFETQIATGHCTRIDSRAATKIYNKKLVEGLKKTEPG